MSKSRIIEQLMTILVGSKVKKKITTLIGMALSIKNFVRETCLPMGDTLYSNRGNMITPDMQDLFPPNIRGLLLYSPIPERVSQFFACVPLIRMVYSGTDSGCPTVKDLSWQLKDRETMDGVIM